MNIDEQDRAVRREADAGEFGVRVGVVGELILAAVGPDADETTGMVLVVFANDQVSPGRHRDVVAVSEQRLPAGFGDQRKLPG